jgi:quinohemoprotein ethanol dehydrogenase
VLAVDGISSEPKEPTAESFHLHTGFRRCARKWRGWLGVLSAALVATVGVQTPAMPGAAPAAVTQQRLENPDPGQWITVGRTPAEQRFSPLKQIDDANVGRLGLAWYAELNTYRGVESTPIELDGVLYNVSAWDITTAYDAATGKVIWTYDPKIDVKWARIACCGPVSRGLAAWHGKIIVATLDGRLIALGARTGKPVWSADTLEPGQPLSITGAPRIADGKVVVGNSGGDLGARGYISAYDADTGKFAWKFWIVPGDPSKHDGAASDSIMPTASKTWHGDWWTKGGGGNDWDSIVYDPKQHLVIFGTGNGSPHPLKFRSPGGGDNLFLCSVVAVDARTGRYRWHYQEIPGEEWDYDCTEPLVLADLKIGGRARQVVMQAPKDGFFYVIDRTTGKLISAKAYVPNTWASGVDLKTGRPRINADAFPTEHPHLLTPGYGGGHLWNPMSFSPKTGLVYIPAQETWMVESVVPDDKFKFVLGQSTLGAGFSNEPELRKQLNAEAAAREKGYLLAWDPVRQKEAFRVPHPHAGNGGTTVTAGNLLIQGTIGKTLAIYRADNGRKLWEMPVGSVPVSGAAVYSVHGRQYIAINAGWNSAVVNNLDEGGVAFSYAPARLLVFALDAKGLNLPPAPAASEIPPPPSEAQPRDKVEAGAALYETNCAICHGHNATGGVRDLRHLTPEAHTAFLDIVIGGKLKASGMESFADKLSQDQAEAIHAYLISRAQEDWQPDFAHPRRK